MPGPTNSGLGTEPSLINNQPLQPEAGWLNLFGFDFLFEACILEFPILRWCCSINAAMRYRNLLPKGKAKLFMLQAMNDGKHQSTGKLLVPHGQQMLAKSLAQERSMAIVDICLMNFSIAALSVSGSRAHREWSRLQGLVPRAVEPLCLASCPSLSRKRIADDSL